MSLRYKIILLFLFAALAVSAQTYTGKVTYIVDGDTFDMMVSDKKIRVRIWGVDCPEKGQRYYYTARSLLWSMIKGRTVTVTKVDTSYNRIVGRVEFEKKDIGLEMIKNGLAWWYQHFAPKRKDYQAAETAAKKQHLGLWFDEKPVPPWGHRKSYDVLKK